MLNYDKKLSVAIGKSRKVIVWSQVQVMWSAFVERVSQPVRGAECFATYLGWPKVMQDEAKDVGGFVGGVLKENRRKTGHVVSRQLVTLDLDHVGAGETESVLARVEALEVAYVVYSTRKHCSQQPRLRVVIPLEEAVSGARYESVARQLAERIGMDWMDSTTFDASRLMYWPSCCADGEFVFRVGDKPFYEAKVFEEKPQPKMNESPVEKKGMIGDFCRKYPILKAIDKFLPGVYVPTLQKDRLTYRDGTTTGGAVLYEDGHLLYSHHHSDPCSQKLVNAFDLVRIHKFGHLGEKESQKAMLKFAQEEVEDWKSKITLHYKTGLPEVTPENVITLLEGHPLTKGRLKKDIFQQRIMGVAPLPWAPRDKESALFLWTDEDFAGLRNFVSKHLGFRVPDVVRDGFTEVYSRHLVHPIREYLEKLEWDGKPRVETLFIDWLAAEDVPHYTRLATRQFLKAMVKRVFEPGCEYQEVVVLVGEQGASKSNFLRHLSKGWFLDTLDCLDTKVVGERTEGAWLVNLDELKALKRVDDDARKEFISRREEKFRPAYGEFTKVIKRSFVLAATTNRREFLGDVTGNRRYIPILCGNAEKIREKQMKCEFKDEVDQIFAEAMVLYREDPFIGIPQEYWALFEEQREFFKYDNDFMENVFDILDQANYPERVSLEWMIKRIEEVQRSLGVRPWPGASPSREQRLKIMDAIQRTKRYEAVMKPFWVNDKTTRNGFKLVPNQKNVRNVRGL